MSEERAEALLQTLLALGLATTTVAGCYILPVVVYAALTGLVRSRDSRWEASGELIIRPVIVGGRGPLEDIEVSGNARLLHNFLLTDVTAAQVGIDAEVSYFTNPPDAFRRFASDRNSLSYYVGAVFGVRFGR